jgi:lysophospholipase L1-like esterase
MKILALQITALFCALLSATEIPVHVATAPVPQDDPNFPEWAERHEKLNALSKKGEAKLVFLGDSITEFWESEDAGKSVWEKFWAPLNAANFGIRGDRTENVLWRLANGNLDGLKPKLIVLMIGTNNTGYHKENNKYHCTAQQTADGIKGVIEKLKARCPTSKILLLAIFPRGEEIDDPLRKQNNETNAKIKAFADEKTIHFLDIGAKFLKPNGDGIVTLMPDMLHLSTDGYKIWAEAIAAKVRSLMQ